jgi:3-oxoacyl-[acyl-carrier-protein] synthase II
VIKDLNRVVITGMGAITPLGNSVEEFWKNAIAGKSGVGEITKFNTENFKTKFAAEVKDFNPSLYFEKNDARKYDLYVQYAIAASQEAIINSKIDLDNINKNKIGVIWGSGNGGIGTFQDQLVAFVEGGKTPRFNPYFVPKMLGNMASGIISIRHGFKGVNFTTISACASANTALIEAFNYIRLGKADIIITGGSEAPICESTIGGFNALKALSTKNETYDTACKPFDEDRDGFIMGEGAGALILESLSSALKRGAPILAEVVGSGMTADAYHLTSTHPEGEGAYLGMLEAIEEAGINPDEIDYINAHATSTPTGDSSELIAIERLFGLNLNLSISATKSMTGHLLGAAGAIESILCVNAIRFGIIPPTINSVNIDKEFKDKFNLTLNQAQVKEVKYALSNTFGFGGHVATTLFKKYTV